MVELQTKPLGLPLELQREDRRELDLLVFELLGVRTAKRREELVDRLYRETALYYRGQRIQDIQSTINRSQGRGGGKVSPLNLAFSAWEELEPEWQTPLAVWLEEQSHHAKTVEIPDGEVRLPDAINFFEATTIYFGKKPAVSHVCASRDEAELIASIAQAGLRGPVSIPTIEKECRQVSNSLEKRIADAEARLDELAQQYTGTDKLREQVADILKRWFIHGKSE